MKKKENKHLPLHLLKRIIDDCHTEGWRYSFGQTYEPFLHPQLDEIISYINNTGTIFSSTTNGSLLSEKFYDLPMNLTISISATEDDYTYRGGKSNFTNYTTTISNFVKYRIKKEPKED